MRRLGIDPKELQRAIEAVTGIAPALQKDIDRKILKEAAKPLLKAAKANVGESDEPHFRYDTPKLSRRLRAPKGKGRVVGVYYSGNLRKSIRILPLRKAKGVIVGPKVARGGRNGGIYTGARVDGYYAHWYEYGTIHYSGKAYMRRGFESTKSTVTRKIIAGVDGSLRKYIRRKKA